MDRRPAVSRSATFPPVETPPFELRPLSGALGAELRGVDVRELDEAGFAALRRAFVDHGVLAIRDQSLSEAEQVEFARRLGEPDVHPIVEGTERFPELVRVVKPAGASASFGVGWHSDNSFFEEPSLASVLYGVTIPPYGGDTLFASMEQAYRALSDRLRAFLGPLRAIHSARRAYDPRVTGEEKYRGEAPIRYRYSEAVDAEAEHPVVRAHPETGRRSLFVNPMFTDRIVGLHREESDAVLELLYRHGARPEFGCRLRWEPGTLALWDNRQVWHYALDDYRDFERVMRRVTIRGERPLQARAA